MQKKSFSKITVSEIIADCGLNRKTFYYHFEDIYALLKWIFDHEAVEVVKHFDLTIDYEEAILFVMDYVEKNDYLINCAFDSIGREKMKHFFYADFIQLTSSIIDSAQKEAGSHLDPEYKNFLCQFYTEALASILIDWIRNRETRNRTRTIQFVSNTLKISLQGIMGADLFLHL